MGDASQKKLKTQNHPKASRTVNVLSVIAHSFCFAFFVCPRFARWSSRRALGLLKGYRTWCWRWRMDGLWDRGWDVVVGLRSSKHLEDRARDRRQGRGRLLRRGYWLGWFVHLRPATPELADTEQTLSIGKGRRIWNGRRLMAKFGRASDPGNGSMGLRWLEVTDTVAVRKRLSISRSASSRLRSPTAFYYTRVIRGYILPPPPRKDHER
ncbi:hypothetical protein MMC08_006721 [Hypocenomyce scalaris]|nr:hypothetical protein [Hypocenomyce scalaris]